MLEKIGARIVAVGSLVLMCVLLGAGLASLHYRTKLTEARMQVESLGDSLREQNKAIDALRADADRRKAEADQRVAQAAAKARGDERAAQEILSAQRPSGVDACRAADLLLDRELRK